MKYVLFSAIIIVIVYMVITVNKFVSLKKNVERSKAVIDVFLKKRYDLIPNLVECIKGYTTYEEKTLSKIINLRNAYNNNDSDDVKNELNNEFNKLIMLIENYPDLKASEQFLNLQKSLSKIESEIQAARRIYINDITIYNTKVDSFPSNVIASLMNNEKLDLPTYEYEETKIKFN